MSAWEHFPLPPALIKHPHPLKPLSDVRAHELDFLREAACSLSGVAFSVDHSSGSELTLGGESPVLLRRDRVGVKKGHTPPAEHRLSCLCHHVHVQVAPCSC